MMKPILEGIVDNWKYVVGGISFVTTVLAVFAGWQGLRKSRIDIRKLRLETEAKEDETLARLDSAWRDDEAIRFEYVRLDPENSEWIEIEAASLDEQRNKRIVKAAHVLEDFDLGSVRISVCGAWMVAPAVGG